MKALYIEIAVIAAWAALCCYWRYISCDDDTYVEDDPDVWTGPW